jgi:hypothetical protein
MSKFIAFSILILSLPFVGIAQDDNFHTWTSVGIKKSINNLELSSEAEIRKAGFYEKTLRSSLEIAAYYDISKVIEVGPAYTLIQFYDSKYNDYQIRHRFDFAVTGKLKINRFTLRLREQIEYTKKDESDRIRDNGSIDTYRINPELLWRNRLKISYNVKGIPLTPSLAAESFYQLNNPDGNIFEKFRYTMSLSYKVAKHHEFQLFNLINQDRTEPDSQTEYVLGLGYTFDF